MSPLVMGIFTSKTKIWATNWVTRRMGAEASERIDETLKYSKERREQLINMEKKKTKVNNNNSPKMLPLNPDEPQGHSISGHGEFAGLLVNF